MASAPRSGVKALYTGLAPRAVRFRYALIVFDLLTVAYFIAVTPFPTTPGMRVINSLLAIIILADLLARFWIAENRWQYLLQIYVIADIVVLCSFVLQPFIQFDLSFLRILFANMPGISVLIATVGLYRKSGPVGSLPCP